MEEKKELTREERLEIEEQAINALISMGATFKVPLKLTPKEAPWWVRQWNKLFPNNPKIYRDRRIPKDWDVTIEEVPDATQQKMVKTYMRQFIIKPL